MSRVYYWHLRALKYCNRGLKAWFNKRGVAWADLIENGVDAELLKQSGDAMAIRAVEFAESTGFSKTPSSGQEGV